MIRRMEIIDGNWIKQRLAPTHGAKSALADSIGLARDKLARVLNGTRKLTPQEIALVVQYFERQGGAEPQPTQKPEKGAGMAEGAAPFSIKAHDPAPEATDQLLSAVFGKAAKQPASYRILRDHPAFALLTGDIVVVDLSRQPQPGETALVSIIDDNVGESTTEVLRYLPPHLLSGDTGQPVSEMRLGDSNVIVRHPIIGCIRGLSG